MVKGVNHSIIEINETGNPVFNRVILCIDPQFIGRDSLVKEEAMLLLGQLSVKDAGVPLRVAYRKRRRFWLLLGGIAALLALGTVFFFIQ